MQSTSKTSKEKHEIRVKDERFMYKLC